MATSKAQFQDKASKAGLFLKIPLGNSSCFKNPTLLGILWLNGIMLGNSGMLIRKMIENKLREMPEKNNLFLRGL